MLISLHVKNLALIKETEVNFKEGLNILSGETGAGKSIIIGSINLALGARADKDMIRTGAEYALVELVFQITDEDMLSQIKELEIPVEEDGIIIIQRKIQPARSICKICGETATTKQLKELSELLIDIHGQHEHQSLLYKKNHLSILDSFAGDELSAVKNELKKTYHIYNELQKELNSFDADEGVMAKELSLAEFEYQEIEDARLVLGEDEELETAYRRMTNSRQIVEAASKAYQMTGSGDEQTAADAVGRAVRELHSIEAYDSKAAELVSELANIDNLLSDFNRSIAEYLSDMEFDGQVFADTEERLNLLNHLKLKYGGTIEKVLEYQKEVEEKIEKLRNADAYKLALQSKLKNTTDVLQKLCMKASGIRLKEAKKLSSDMVKALTDLNFLEVQFEIQVRQKEEYSSSGFDDVEFMISTNPGEPLKSLGNVASGGELSRIMLAIKTVLASRDKIPTMIFDEIDTGISGKTAWKVSEKLGALSAGHQIICITHLPQIAAMADHHFRIAKQAVDNATVTGITQLEDFEVIEELARLLGGEEITDTVRENAKELLCTAAMKKKEYR
ncbi:MAG: DNA repair protein RecN [Lachnospiraceae bacterium]|nr:DNA repair protein RecN [Lachnospiraceae bacterium]